MLTSVEMALQLSFDLIAYPRLSRATKLPLQLVSPVSASLSTSPLP